MTDRAGVPPGERLGGENRSLACRLLEALEHQLELAVVIEGVSAIAEQLNRDLTGRC